LRHVRELEEEVDLWKGLGTGRVAIGVDPESELSLLPEILSTFVPAHPGVQVTVRSGHTEELLPALLGGELHFLVTDAELALERDDLEIHALAADPIVVAVRPGHPLASKREPGPTDAEHFPLAGASTAPRFEQWRADQGLRDVGHAFAPSLICDNYEVLVQLGERSDALVFGPSRLLATYAQAGRLKVMPWVLEGPDIEPSLIRSKGRILSPAAEKIFGLFLNRDRLAGEVYATVE